MKDYSKISNFDDLIELEYGAIGTESRIEFEAQSKLFVDSEMLKEAQREATLAPEQLANKPMYSIEISPLVKSLSGVLKLDKDFDFKKSYAEYLAEKYKWESCFWIRMLKNVYLLKVSPSFQPRLSSKHNPMSIKFLITEEDYQQALEQLFVLFDAKMGTSESDEADSLVL